MPFVSTLDCREGPVAVEGERSVGGIRPRDDGVKVLDDLPMGKEELGLPGVGKLERAQEEARGVEFDGGEAGRHGRKDLAQYTGWHLHTEWSFM